MGRSLTLGSLTLGSLHLGSLNLGSPAETEATVRRFIRAWHLAQLRRLVNWFARLLLVSALVPAPATRAEQPATILLSDASGPVGLLTLPLLEGMAEGMADGMAGPAAVILVHDVGGIDHRSGRTSAALLAAGIAVLEIETRAVSADGFALPGLGQAMPDIGTELAALARARQALATTPAVDGARVAALGFGRGAHPVALLPVRAEGGADWAARVLLYPGCASLAAALTADPDASRAPLLLMHGGADPGNTPADCDDLADRLDELGAATRVLTYAGATHGWDLPDFGLFGLSFQPHPSGSGRLPVRPWPELAQVSAAQAAGFLWAALRAVR